MLAVLTGCQTDYVKRRDVLPGTYSADLKFGTETLTLRKDGTTTITYEPYKGKKQTVTGQWSFADGKLDLSNMIDVDDSVVPSDISTTRISGLAVVDGPDYYAIEMNDDTNYFLGRYKTPDEK